jgi:hypothetical protein
MSTYTKQTFATKEERFEFEKRRMEKRSCTSKPGFRRTQVVTARPRQAEEPSPAQVAYDAQMRDRGMRAMAMAERWEEIAGAILVGMSTDQPWVRTLGIGGSPVTIHRADFERVLATCEAEHWKFIELLEKTRDGVATLS